MTSCRYIYIILNKQHFAEYVQDNQGSKHLHSLYMYTLDDYFQLLIIVNTVVLVGFGNMSLFWLHIFSCISV